MKGTSMDDIQQPQPAQAPEPMAPVGPTPQFHETHTATPKADEPRNFLATFLLTSPGGGLLGLRNFYLGQKTIGFVRLGLFLSYFLLMIVSAFARSAVLGFIATLLLLIAYIWSIVDFFVVYFSVKTDAEGQPLARTARDTKWAKTIFIVTVVVSTLAIIAAIALAMTGERLLKRAVDQSETSNSSYQSGTKLDLDNYNFDSNHYSY